MREILATIAWMSFVFVIFSLIWLGYDPANFILAISVVWFLIFGVPVMWRWTQSRQ